LTFVEASALMRRTSVLPQGKTLAQGGIHFRRASSNRRGPHLMIKWGSQNMNLMLGFDETAGLI